MVYVLSEVRETSTLNGVGRRTPHMASELEHDCPNCGGEKTFYRAAATELHLGQKTKWSCPDCDYGFVRIDGDIDSSVTA